MCNPSQRRRAKKLTHYIVRQRWRQLFSRIIRLAYAHENGVVLVDIIQKCVIISASLSDLYGGASMMPSNRDISIQPFATSSILQHHYQSTHGLPDDFGAATAAAANNGPDNGCSRANEIDQQQQHLPTGTSTAKTTKTDNENGTTNNGSFHKSALGSSNESTITNQVSLSRLATHRFLLLPSLSACQRHCCRKLTTNTTQRRATHPQHRQSISQ